MHLVACHARHRRLIGEIGAHDAPWTGGVLRLNKIADRAIEMHAMAAETIVHEPALSVVHRVGEDLRVGSAVRSGMPGCIFMLMAFLAVRGHRKNVDIAKADRLRSVAGEMDADVAQLGGRDSASWQSMQVALRCAETCTALTYAVISWQLAQPCPRCDV